MGSHWSHSEVSTGPGLLEHSWADDKEARAKSLDFPQTVTGRQGEAWCEVSFIWKWALVPLGRESVTRPTIGVERQTSLI